MSQFRKQHRWVRDLQDLMACVLQLAGAVQLSSWPEALAPPVVEAKAAL